MRSFQLFVAGIIWEAAVCFAAESSFLQVAEFSNKTISCITANSDAVYAVVNDGTLFRSTDGGASWDIRSTVLPGDARKIVSSVNPENLYSYGSDTIGISRDVGSTWLKKSLVDIGVDSKSSMTYLVNVDETLILDVFNKVSLKSCDGGDTWDTLSTGRLSISGNLLYTQKSNDSIYLSADIGKTWHSIS